MCASSRSVRASKETVGGGFSAPTILEQNRIAKGDRLAPPMGELSPQVTERAYTLSGLDTLSHLPHRGRQDVLPGRYINIGKTALFWGVFWVFGDIVFGLFT